MLEVTPEYDSDHERELGAKMEAAVASKSGGVPPMNSSNMWQCVANHEENGEAC